MASMEEIITELRRLRPDQVDEVARIIHNLSQTGHEEAALPAHIVDEAVRHGWPTELFTDLIGSLPELERAAQPAVENRTEL
jgi:hypothetical protein